MASPVERVRVPEHVLTRVVDNELVLLNLDNEQFYGLDEVGASIWQALIDANTVDEAVNTLLETFDVEPEVLSVDVQSLLGELQSRGLVELDP